MSSLKALRDAGRFVGKEDTVPLRLLYSRHNHSQITEDELSTRVKASSGSSQVHSVLLSGWRGVSAWRLCVCVLLSAACVFMFVSPPLSLFSEGKTNN